MSAAPSRSVTTRFIFIFICIFLVAFLRVSARTSMARRSLGVAAETRKTLATRSLTRPLSTFPEMQNALDVEQARRRGLVARRRDGLFSNWSSIRNVYRHTGGKRRIVSNLSLFIACGTLPRDSNFKKDSPSHSLTPLRRRAHHGPTRLGVLHKGRSYAPGSARTRAPRCVETCAASFAPAPRLDRGKKTQKRKPT